MSDLDDDLKIRAAWLYYKEGLTQDQVAQELGITRTRVLRMLAACRSDGTVQIRVVAKQSRCIELERAIEKRYKMERAIVVPVPQRNEQVTEIIGAVLGEYLTDILLRKTCRSGSAGARLSAPACLRSLNSNIRAYRWCHSWAA